MEKTIVPTTPRAHWFYQEGQKWIDYPYSDSDFIEKIWLESNGKGQLSLPYHNRTIYFALMKETTQDIPEGRQVLRGNWFFIDDEKIWVPYDAEISKKLENAFNHGVFLKGKVEITNKPPRDVVMHADGHFKQYRRTKGGSPLGRDVTRGWKNQVCNVYPGYPAPYHLQIFGVSLPTVMTHPMNLGKPVPCVFASTLHLLSNEGTKTEGIFRISGSATRIDELKRKFDAGTIPNLTEEDVHNVGGLLKQYIRELPEPLLVKETSDWMQCYDPDNQKTVENIKKLFAELPSVNKIILVSLTSLLNSISKNNTVTKMNSSNLAICWAPNIFKTDANVGFSGEINQLTSFFIEHHNSLFK